MGASFKKSIISINYTLNTSAGPLDCVLIGALGFDFGGGNV